MSNIVRVLILVTLLVSSNQVVGCSLATSAKFVPSMEQASIGYKNPHLTKGSDGASYYEQIPHPEIGAVTVTRGRVGKSVYHGCNELGTMMVEVSLPDAVATYSLENLGVYLRIIEGNFDPNFMPLVPVKLRQFRRFDPVCHKLRSDWADKYLSNPNPPPSPKCQVDEEDDPYFIYLDWVEKNRANPTPLNLKIEAFFVTNNLEIGPSTFFSIRNAGVDSSE